MIKRIALKSIELGAACLVVGFTYSMIELCLVKLDELLSGE